LPATSSRQATFAGPLAVNLVNGSQPASGAHFQVMTFASASGTFAALGGDGSLFTATYNPGDVTLVRR
jgi:hypothetical protein